MRIVAAQSPRSRLICGLALVLLAACASGPKVRVDKDSHVDFAQYKTFGWLEQSAAAGAQSDTQRMPSTLITQRVHSSINAALQSKGYALRETDPDFRVSYALNAYERPKQSGMRLGLGAGGGSGHVGGGVGISVPLGKRNEAVAAMTIDIIDARRNAQAWTGSFESLVRSLEVSDTEIDQLVAAILAKFP